MIVRVSYFYFICPFSPLSGILVGGPGNGKTEAVEDILRTLDANLGLGGSLTTKFTALFSGDGGLSIPRLANVSLEGVSRAANILEICIVQDASVTDPSCPKQSPASCSGRGDFKATAA